MPWDKTKDVTLWTDCHLTFSPMGTGKCKISGVGTSLWRNQTIEFGIEGDVDTSTWRFQIVKTHLGKYHNTIVYDGLLDTTKPTLQGQYTGGSLSLAPCSANVPPTSPTPLDFTDIATELSRRLSGMWEGQSIREQTGEVTVWAKCMFNFCVVQDGLGKISGNGESVWRGQVIPFRVEGTFDIRNMIANLVKIHVGKFTNSVAYQLNIDAVNMKLDGHYAHGSLTLHKMADNTSDFARRSELPLSMMQTAVAVAPQPVAAAAAAVASAAADANSSERKLCESKDPPAISVALLASSDDNIDERYRLFLGGLIVSGKLNRRQQEALESFRSTCRVSDELHVATLSKLGLTLQDFEKMKTVEESVPEEELCKICYDARIDCVLLPCGHMAICYKCSRKLNACPVCRKTITEAKVVFRA